MPLTVRLTAIVRKPAIAVDVFLLFVYAFLVSTPVVGQSATQLNVIPANTVTGRSAVSEDGPTSSPRLNTNIVTGTSAVTEDDPTSSTHLNTNIVTGTSSIHHEDDPTPLTRLNTTELSPVTVIDEPTLESLPTYRASVQVKQIYLPLVIAAGTFGNGVVVVIQSRLPPKQKSSMSVYFTALAISDTTTLWMGWFYLLETFGVTLSVEYHMQRHYSDVIMDALCRIRVWISYAFNQMSAWILVAMTTHRAVSIVWPHGTGKLLKRCNAVMVVVSIVSFCALTNVHLLYGHSLQPTEDSQRADCFLNFVSDEYRMFFRLDWVWIDMAAAVFLPFACLLVTNTVLVRKVGQSLREARDSLAEGRSDPFASRDKKLSSMTITLIATSVAFLVLTSPIAVYMIWDGTLPYDALRDVRFFAASELALSVSLMVWYTNLGINFYLYCLTGARYRAEFLKLFGCGGSTDRTFRHTPPSAVGKPSIQTACPWMLTEEMLPISVSL